LMVAVPVADGQQGVASAGHSAQSNQCESKCRSGVLPFTRGDAALVGMYAACRLLISFWFGIAALQPYSGVWCGRPCCSGVCSEHRWCLASCSSLTNQ
jgi:hypothetical protein